MSESGRKATDARSPPDIVLNLSLLCHLQGVIYLDSEITDRTFEFSMTQKQLDRPEILGAPIDQGRLRPPHGMGTVSCSIETDTTDPPIDDARILARG